MRMLPICLAVFLLISGLAIAQQEPTTTSCDFDNGMEVSVQYTTTTHDEPRNGKLWMPGGAPLTLYTQTALVLNNVTIPIGAFHMYVIPGRKDWTLIVNKNVTAGSKYDQAEDLVRAPMEIGEIGQEVKDVQISLAHTAPKTCSLRIYYAKTGAFVEFGEK